MNALHTLWSTARNHAPQGGQSLVEVAVSLPILIMLLAGVVEVSNLVMTQNRVTTSARVATGFGAANFDESDWVGTANAMGTVAMNTVTETLDLEPDMWDIWTIQAKTNTVGDAFEVFEAEHVYGNNQVVSTSRWAGIMPNVQADMLAELQAGGADTSELKVVATVNYHDIPNILGLPVWRWANLEEVRGLTVMRVDEQAPYQGCSILPISIFFENYSMYTSDYTGPAVHYPGLDPVERYAGNEYDHPLSPPVYTNADPSGFPFNSPGYPIAQAQPGYIYRARAGSGTGSFGWLAWNPGAANASDLRDSLSYPGNYTSDPADPDPTKILFTNAQDPNDHDLSVGDWVQTSTGNMNSATDIIDAYIDAGRPVKILVFNDTIGTGNNKQYRVAGFVVVRILGRKTTGSDKRLEIEFISWSNSACESTAP